MVEDRSKQDHRDDVKIDINDPNEVEYASKKLGVYPQVLKDAVAKVGNSRAAVEEYLKK